MDDMTGWSDKLLCRIEEKFEKVTERNRGRIPYTADDDGRWIDRGDDIGWWTNGFWGGLMWQLHAYSGKALYREEAIRSEEALDRCFLDYGMLDHDNGFRWLPTAVAHYRVDNNPSSLNRGLLAASHLAGRYNTDGGFIRAWNPFKGEDHTGWAIIDCMMNLPLLYWASDVTGDPRFSQIARHHADKALSTFLRPDGSVNHIVVFDPADGTVIGTKGGQGYAVGSSWTRGQGWALYGFLLSYMHTGDERYLMASRRVASYFLSNLPESGLVPIDFRQPVDVDAEDSTAAAIASSALISLARLESGRDREVHLRGAERMQRALASRRLDLSNDTDYLLRGGSVAYDTGEWDMPIVYGDYYFVEALLKLEGRELPVW